MSGAGVGAVFSFPEPIQRRNVACSLQRSLGGLCQTIVGLSSPAPTLLWALFYFYPRLEGGHFVP